MRRRCCAGCYRIRHLRRVFRGGRRIENTVYGVNETVQINGVNVKLLGYRMDPISGMVGNYAGKTFITVCIGLDNQSEQTVKMGNTTEPNWPRC